MSWYDEWNHWQQFFQGARPADVSDLHENQMKWYASQLPVVGDFMRAYEQQKYYEDYFKNTGLTWDNIQYPSLLGGVNYGGAVSSAGQSFLSMKMLKRMYK